MSAATLSPAANPRKTTTIRKLGPVDIAALQAAVMAITEDYWDAENARKPNKYEVLDQSRHIVFRYNDSRHGDWARFACIVPLACSGAACWSRCWCRRSAVTDMRTACSRA